MLQLQAPPGAQTTTALLTELLGLPFVGRAQLWADLPQRARAELVAFMSTHYGTTHLLYHDAPVEFVQHVLGEHVTRQQTEVLRAVAEHRRTSVPSAHDLGKSFIAARVVAWWVACRPLGEAQVVSTAPTFNQVKAVLWRELARAHARGNLPGRLNLTEWYVTTPEGVDERVAVGRKPADTNPGALQGLHERYVLVLIDEADEVHPNIWQGTDTIVTNEQARVLAIGNPVNAGSEMEKVSQHPEQLPDATNYTSTLGWRVVRLDGFDSPNFTDEPVPDHVRPLLLSRQWVEDYALRYGSTSAAYLSRVRARWPEQRADTVVPYAWVRDRCRHMTEPTDDTPTGLVPQPAADLWSDDELIPVELGVDVGAGGDRTVVVARRGRRCLGVVAEVQSREPNDTTDAVVQVATELQPTSIKVDTIGWGWGIYGQLQRYAEEGKVLPHWLRMVPVNVAQRALDPVRFRNLRSQIWWDVGRELTEHGVWDLSELDREHALELSEPRYALSASGQVQVEPKADTRERLGRSPDVADALLLCYLAMPAQPSGVVLYDERVRIGGPS